MVHASGRYRKKTSAKPSLYIVFLGCILTSLVFVEVNAAEADAPVHTPTSTITSTKPTSTKPTSTTSTKLTSTTTSTKPTSTTTSTKPTSTTTSTKPTSTTSTKPTSTTSTKPTSTTRPTKPTSTTRPTKPTSTTTSTKPTSTTSTKPTSTTSTKPTSTTRPTKPTSTTRPTKPTSTTTSTKLTSTTTSTKPTSTTTSTKPTSTTSTKPTSTTSTKPTSTTTSTKPTSTTTSTKPTSTTRPTTTVPQSKTSKQTTIASTSTSKPEIHNSKSTQIETRTSADTPPLPTINAPDPCHTVTCNNGGTCSVINGTGTCTCITGYTGDHCSTDVNECASSSSNNCSEYASCTNRKGLYDCTCLDGFSGDGYNCTDQDECASIPCSTEATCSNTVGSFQCSCITGYTGHGFNCTDIDECQPGHTLVCHENAVCTNNIGSYSCVCKPGFTGNGTYCEDINECDSNTTNSCHIKAKCQNTPGNYTCLCRPGYTGNGTYCQDIDECRRNDTHGCHHYAECSNTIGSYNCTCDQGFNGNGTSCEDIQECASTDPVCEHGDCLELPGWFFCMCSAAWKGKNCSEDVDECTKNHPCGKQAKCTNLRGNYTCSCPLGYRGDPAVKCFREVLLNITKSAKPITADPINPTVKIQYFGKTYSSIYVSQYGLISLGRRVPNRDPPLSWPRNVPIVAALWSNIDVNSSDNTSIINVDTSTEALQEYKLIQPNSTATFVLVVTWKNVAPFSGMSNPSSERADFQLVLAASETNTDIMLNYDQERFTWKPFPGRRVVIGQTDKLGEAFIEFNSSDYSTVNEKTNVGIPGRWEYSVGGLSSGKVRDPSVACIEWSTNSTIQEAIHTARADGAACPCTEMHAQTDTRYVVATTMSTWLSKCYTLMTMKTGSKGKELCCYRENGTLQDGYPGGGYFQFEKASNLIDDGLQSCCNDTHMCEIFYEKVSSRSCEGYIPLGSAFVYGDPHFITFDGKKYTFNGRGVYTLLDVNNGSFVVQILTERWPSGTNGTQLVGVVTKDKKDPQIQVNWRNDGLILLREGKKRVAQFMTSTGMFTLLDRPDLPPSRNYTKRLKTRNNTFVIHSQETGFDVQIGFDIQRKALYLTIFSDGRNSELKGFLGNNNGIDTDDIVSATGDINTNASTEESIFDILKSWSITPETDRLFDYTYETYFNDATADSMNSPSYYLSDRNDSTLAAMCPKVSEFDINTSCMKSKACRVDVAAFCDLTYGQHTKTLEDQFTKKQDASRNKPPKFLNMTNVVTAAIGRVMTIAINVTDDSKISLSLNTSLDPEEYKLDSSSNQLTLNLSDVYRNSSQPLYVKVVATDTLGASSMYWPVVKFCGCQESDECQYDKTILSDRSMRAWCNCGPNATGEFCESEIPSCDLDPCYPDVTCNESTPGADHCGPCPDNLRGDGRNCYDVDECEVPGEGTCSQLCENTLGSYECHCHQGYTLETDGQCTDVDECKNNPCSDLEICTNTRGNHTCECRAGFYRSDQQDGSRACHRANVMFEGVLTFEYKERPSNELVIKQLKTMLNGTGGVLFIEILSIQEISRRKREARSLVQTKYKATYLVHYKPGVTYTQAHDKIQTYFDHHEHCRKSDVCPSELGFIINKSDSGIYNDEDSPLCVDGRSTCDPLSTVCTVDNGMMRCPCREGFKSRQGVDTMCADKDECMLNSTLCDPGTCVNLIGSFTCQCPAGYQEVQQTCTDLCQPSPCKNGGVCYHGTMVGDYICKCDDEWTGSNCESQNDQITMLRTTAIVVGAITGGLCLLMFFALIGVYRRNKTKTELLRSMLVKNHLNGFESLELEERDSISVSSSTRRKHTTSIVEMRERQSTLENDLETGMIDEDDSKPLTVLKKETLSGKENSSFLHGVNKASSSTKPEEYF